LSVSEAEVAAAQVEMGRRTGIYAAPEAAATWAALPHLRASGFLNGTERVVLFCTGSGLKYAPPTVG
jgi:threonine synthase